MKSAITGIHDRVPSTSTEVRVHGKGRVEFLDGIRGWASLIVLFHHTFACLLQGVPEYSEKALLFITDGQLAVFVFFVLSGYALSVSHFGYDSERMTRAVAGRYIRLTIPILVNSTIAYLLLKFHLFYNIAAVHSSIVAKGWVGGLSIQWLGSFYNFHAHLSEMLRFALWDVYFNYDPDKSYNSSLWTMNVEFFGSFIIYAYVAIFRSSGRCYWIVALLLLAYFFATDSFGACFVLGYLIAELNVKVKIRTSVWAEVAAMSTFASVPLISTFARPGPSADWQTELMAAILILAVSYSALLRRLFTTAVSTFLGRISFPLYLIQICIICSLSSYLMIVLTDAGWSRLHVANAVALITIASSLSSACLLTPVESISVRLSKLFGELIVKTSGSRKEAPSHGVRDRLRPVAAFDADGRRA